MRTSSSEVPITLLLQQWASGDPTAQQTVWDQLYSQLHHLAHHVLMYRRKGGGMGTTSLLHNAALELMNLDIEWQDRKHFFAVCARCMRFTLADEARRQLAKKRGQGHVLVGLPDEVTTGNSQDLGEVLAVHQALERLAAIDADQAQLVELRYFAGMTVDETAEIMNLSKPTVVRKWKSARIWLKAQFEQHT